MIKAIEETRNTSAVCAYRCGGNKYILAFGVTKNDQFKKTLEWSPQPLNGDRLEDVAEKFAMSTGKKGEPFDMYVNGKFYRTVKSMELIDIPGYDNLSLEHKLPEEPVENKKLEKKALAESI